MPTITITTGDGKTGVKLVSLSLYSGFDGGSFLAALLLKPEVEAV